MTEKMLVAFSDVSGASVVLSGTEGICREMHEAGLDASDFQEPDWPDCGLWAWEGEFKYYDTDDGPHLEGTWRRPTMEEIKEVLDHEHGEDQDG